MPYRLHRLVQKDVDSAMRWYETNASDRIADEFFEELIATLDCRCQQP